MEVALEDAPPLTTLVHKMLLGEEVIIAENGEPVARLEPVGAFGTPRTHAFLDEPLEEVDERFPEIKEETQGHRRIGGDPTFVVYMAEDFNTSLEDF